MKIFPKLFIKKEKISTITVLFPGSFKPMHGGHLDLILKYAQHPYVNSVKVFIGPGVRNGITQQIAYEVATLLLEGHDNVEVEMTNEKTPILACYKYMYTANEGVYALAGTTKGEDYKRVIKFVNDFDEKNPKHYINDHSTKVIEFKLKNKPLNYLNRTDEYNYTPISGTILRRDLINNNENQFWTNYPFTHKSNTKKIWDIVKSVIVE